MTVQTIIERIKLQINDPANFTWSPSMLTSLVNEGYREFIMNSHCLRKHDRIDLAVNTKTFSMPSDVLMIYRAEFDGIEIPIFTTPSADSQLPSGWRNLTGLDVMAIVADHEGYGTIRIYPTLEADADLGTGLIQGSDGVHVYRCIQDHTSAAASRPTSGADYAEYWEVTTGDIGDGSAWADITDYTIYKGLDVDYAYMPTADLTTTDTPVIPARYHPALIEYGLALAQQQEKQSARDFGSSSMHWQNFNRYWKQARRDSQRGFIFNRRPMVHRNSII